VTEKDSTTTHKLSRLLTSLEDGNMVPCIVSFSSANCMHAHEFDSQNDSDSRKTSLCKASFPNIQHQILALARDVLLNV